MNFAAMEIGHYATVGVMYLYACVRYWSYHKIAQERFCIWRHFKGEGFWNLEMANGLLLTVF